MKTIKGTKIIRVDPEHPEENLIRLAARVIKRGGLVAYPTDTVYGLAANALDEEAIKKVFLAKERKTTNPLIIHLSKKEEVYKLVIKVSPLAEELMSKFWPGALTLIFEAKAELSSLLTAKGRKIGIRIPNHRIALKLITLAGVPVTSPSANLSGNPAPVDSQEVIKDLAGRIELIIVGGETNLKVPSTIVDLTREPPLILREGAKIEGLGPILQKWIVN